jgi:hypothetical protein
MLIWYEIPVWPYIISISFEQKKYLLYHQVIMLGVLFTIWSVLTTSLDDIIGWFKIIAFFVGLVVVYRFMKMAKNNAASVAATLGDGVPIEQPQPVYSQPSSTPIEQLRRSSNKEVDKMKLGAAQLWNCAQCRGMLDANFGLNRDRTRALCRYCRRRR